MSSGCGIDSDLRERPVDRPTTCYRPVPQSVEVVLRRIQILCFDTLTEGGHNAAKRIPLTAPLPNDDRKTA